MWVVEFLKKTFEGRGVYATLIAVFSWIYTCIMVGIFICQVFLYIFKVRYSNPSFDKSINKKPDKNKE